jgi:hypothetical protein
LGQKAFDNSRCAAGYRYLPNCGKPGIPGQSVWSSKVDGELAYPRLVGTDLHTTAINGLGVLGVGGIEAEAAGAVSRYRC